MSFRKFGGLNYAPKNNIVGSNYNTSNNLIITNNVGQPNSYINFVSDISGNINIDINGNIIANDISANDIRIHNMTANDISINDMSANDISIHDMSANDISINDMSANDISIHDMSANDISINDMSANDISVNDMSANYISVNDMSANNIYGISMFVNEDPQFYSYSNSVVPKSYINATSNGIKVLQECQCATTKTSGPSGTGTIILSGQQTIDGYVVQNGNRVLVQYQNYSTTSKYQGDPANGVYDANTSGAWTIASDYSGNVYGCSIFCQYGMINNKTTFIQTNYCDTNTGTAPPPGTSSDPTNYSFFCIYSDYSSTYGNGLLYNPSNDVLSINPILGYMTSIDGSDNILSIGTDPSLTTALELGSSGIDTTILGELYVDGGLITNTMDGSNNTLSIGTNSSLTTALELGSSGITTTIQGELFADGGLFCNNINADSAANILSIGTDPSLNYQIILGSSGVSTIISGVLFADNGIICNNINADGPATTLSIGTDHSLNDAITLGSSGITTTNQGNLVVDGSLSAASFINTSGTYYSNEIITNTMDGSNNTLSIGTVPSLTTALELGSSGITTTIQGELFADGGLICNTIDS